jgi:hypothetical protein
METYDPISRARVNLVDVGGRKMPDPLMPASAWAIGGLLVFPATLWLLGHLLGLSLVTVFLAATAGFMSARWVARETGGDHRLSDLAKTGAAEARSTIRRWKARR